MLHRGAAPRRPLLAHHGRPAVPRVRVGQRGDLRRGLPGGRPGGGRGACRPGPGAHLCSGRAVPDPPRWRSAPGLPREHGGGGVERGPLARAAPPLHHAGRGRAARAAGAPGRRTLGPMSPLFVVWANLHGGFFFGCITIALYAAGELLEGLLSAGPRRPGSPARATTRVGARPGTAREPGESPRVRAPGARLRLLRQQRDPAADPGVHVPRLPHDQREALPAGAAGRRSRPSR